MATAKDGLYERLAKVEKILQRAKALNSEDKAVDAAKKLEIITTAEKTLENPRAMIPSFKDGDKKENITRLLYMAETQLKQTGYDLEPKETPASPKPKAASDTSVTSSWCLFSSCNKSEQAASATVAATDTETRGILSGAQKSKALTMKRSDDDDA